MGNELEDARQKRLDQITGMYTLLMWLTSRRYTRLLQPFGLTFAQYMVLSVLALHQGRCTMSDLANVSPHQDPAATTGVIDRLVKQGWAARRRSDTDRRVVMVGITDAGMELVEAVKQRFADDNTAFYEDVTDGDLDLSWNLLRRYLRKEMEHYNWIQQDAIDRELQIVDAFMKDPVAFSKQQMTR
jgi:DNA-binding MarR family transcriptional regulator